MASKNSFGAAATLRVNDREYQIFRLDALEKASLKADISRLPYSIKVLLENLLRFEDGRTPKSACSKTGPRSISVLTPPTVIRMEDRTAYES